MVQRGVIELLAVSPLTCSDLTSSLTLFAKPISTLPFLTYESCRTRIELDSSGLTSFLIIPGVYSNESACVLAHYTFLKIEKHTFCINDSDMEKRHWIQNRCHCESLYRKLVQVIAVFYPLTVKPPPTMTTRICGLLGLWSKSLHTSH